MFVDQLRRIDIHSFIEQAEGLSEQISPRSWASSLAKALREAAVASDWSSFDKLRLLRKKVPAKTGLCECAESRLSILDGARALSLKRYGAVILHMKAALEVKSCPHLASFGPDLLLVNRLINKQLLLEECHDFLQQSQIYGDFESVEELIKKVQIAEG